MFCPDPDGAKKFGGERMRKILALVAGLMMMASVSFAAASAAATSPTKQIELGIDGGLALATNSGYDLGFGGQVSGLYRFDENLGVGLGVGFNAFNVTGSTSTFGASLDDLSILAILKYAFGTDKTKPYILVGAGLGDSIANVTFDSISVSASQMNNEIEGGVGIQFPAGDSLNLFLQATANLLLTSGSTFTYIPVDFGVNFDI